MRRSTLTICLAVLLTGFLATSASAQNTQAGSIAAGAEIGVLFPDEAFEKTIAIGAFGEYYATPAFSIRGLFGWASPGFENFTEDHFREHFEDASRGTVADGASVEAELAVDPTEENAQGVVLESIELEL